MKTRPQPHIGRGNYASKSPQEQDKVTQGVARGDAAKMLGTNRTMRRIAAAKNRKRLRTVVVVLALVMLGSCAHCDPNGCKTHTPIGWW